MLPRVLPKDRFEQFVRFLMKKYRVVGPVDKGVPAMDTGRYAFDVIEDPAQICMDYPISMLPPKAWFFPPYETLLKFKREDGTFKVEAPIEAPPTAIVGMHPCDIYSTWLLDDAFGKDPKDPYYIAKRQRAVIIGLDCRKPCDDYCFCKDMGSLFVDFGYDLMFSDVGDRYFVDVASERGEALVIESGLFSPAGPDDMQARAEFEQDKHKNFQNKLPYDTKYLPELLEQSYDSLIWEATSRRCFSCGSCNLVCPTCYCFDVTDEVEMDLKTGQRVRRWDSCMLKGFAEVAGGENFREHKSERLRHRVMRKGKYLREMFGKSGCVGCGRCDRHCPADISILKIYQQIGVQVSSQAEASV